MIPRCDTHTETVNGAKELALKLERVLWRPDDYPTEAGKCRLCGAELKIVYLCWDVNGGSLEALHATRDRPDRIKRCVEDNGELHKLGIKFYPNFWCETLSFKVVDPAFWKKDHETGYHFNSGIPDGEDFTVTPWLYAERNVNRHKYLARQRFAQSGKTKNNRSKVAPMDRLRE